MALYGTQCIFFLAVIKAGYMNNEKFQRKENKHLFLSLHDHC